MWIDLHDITRRRFLGSTATGLMGIGLANLLARDESEGALSSAQR